MCWEAVPLLDFLLSLIPLTSLAALSPKRFASSLSYTQSSTAIAQQGRPPPSLGSRTDEDRSSSTNRPVSTLLASFSILSMSAAPPPPSPTKRNILRTLVTGVTPTTKDVHEQRWQRSAAAPPTPVKEIGSRPGSVAGLVEGWEASLSGSSRPYSSIPPSPSSPYKASPSIQPYQRPPPLGSNHSFTPSPVSPTRTSVPASIFQAQQARRAPPPTGGKFGIQATAPIGKENQPRLGPSFRLPSQSAQATDSLAPGTMTGSVSGRTDVSGASTALTNETMATRSSNSTHASSLVTCSAENAYVGVASRVEVGSEATPRKISTQQVVGTPIRREPMLRAPQIVETAPTPARSAAASQRPRPVSVHSYAAGPAPSTSAPVQRDHPGPSPTQHRPAPALRPQTSFIEHLPPSCHSPEPQPLRQNGPSPSHTLETDRFKPLPLGNSPQIGHGDSCPPPPPPKTRGRSRASSLGAGLEAPFREEARPETPQQRQERVEADFEKLLDTMQLPDRTVRTKMLGLTLPLKEEMLRSALPPSSSSSTLRLPARPSHQRGRSLNLHDSQQSSTAPTAVGKKEGGSRLKSFLRSTKSNSSLRDRAAKDALSTAASTDGNRARRPSHSRNVSGTSFLSRSFGKSVGATLAAQVATTPDHAADATYCAVQLRSTSCANLNVKELGKLRGRLRTEPPAWVDEFIKSGGYTGMLERLKELLEMEWREEQHDDQVLYEVLRCFKALTMTACGKRALSSDSPTPFLPLAKLLFSEKRPGELPCRQLLVELIGAIFEICPPAADALPKSAWATPKNSLDSAPSSPPPPSSGFPVPSSPSPPSSGFLSNSDGRGSGGGRRYTRKVKGGYDDDDAAIEREEVLTPERVQQARRFVVSLVEGPPDEKEDAKVDFIQQTHRPRVYKTWVKEIADCVRDYFWIFCLANNLFWTLEQVDAVAIETPKVPSGMTGGVEYEAMAYCTAHFRLINAIARTAPTLDVAFQFHNQLFECGFERVLFALRRASAAHYPLLHLEMSRYISLARSAQFNLGARILACLDRRFLSPQEVMVLQQVERQNAAYHSRSGAPQIGAL